MKEFAKKYWITAIMLFAPLIRHFSDNSTVDALMSLIVWGALWVVFPIVMIILLVAIAAHFFPKDMKVDGIEKMAEPLKKLKWWKSLITMSLILGVFIYVDWSGPAILYVINTAGMWAAITMIMSAINKIYEAQGIEPSEPEDEKPDELKNLKKSLLD